MELAAAGDRDVVVAPIGFVSDHMEVIYDLDVEAQQRCREVGLNMIRAPTAGTHPAFVKMIRQLMLERLIGALPRYTGSRGPSHDSCPVTCCLPRNTA
jgi:ferrochelatase